MTVTKRNVEQAINIHSSQSHPRMIVAASVINQAVEGAIDQKYIDAAVRELEANNLIDDARREAFAVEGDTKVKEFFLTWRPEGKLDARKKLYSAIQAASLRDDVNEFLEA